MRMSGRHHGSGGERQAAGRAAAGGTWWSLPAFAMAAAALLGAVWGGLGRMGLATAAPPGALIRSHGVLIANGFFGTVIALERAVALGKPRYYLVPLACGVGSWMALAGGASVAMAGSYLIAAAAAGLVVLFAEVNLREPAVHHLVMGLGAVAWAVAAVLLVLEAQGAGFAVADLTPWWAAFLVLTIAGERLELARVLRPDAVQKAVFFAAVAAVLGGLVARLAGVETGYLAYGAGFVVLAAWLGLWDVARRTASARGLTGYIGRTLLAGYFWLAVGGALLVVLGAPPAGFVYDAQWHAIFVGFVLSMIFAHAPVVLRALTGWQIRFHPAMYIAPAVLHLSLMVRLTGDLTASPYWRLVGGLGNALAIAIFALTVVTRLRRGR